MKKVGIMGGTFNPIHNGHLMIAKAALEQIQLDKVLFMPCGVPYLKAGQNVLGGTLRAEMTGLAIQNEMRFELCTWEIEQEGNTYTADTLLHLKNCEPETEFYFIMGADSLFYIEYWKDPQIIFDNCHVLAAVRNHKTTDEMIQKINQLKSQFQANITLLNTEDYDVSSSDIRKRVMLGQGITDMVPESVEKYIYENHLYTEDR